MSQVDEEFKKIWRSIPVDSMDDAKIEEYLEKQGTARFSINFSHLKSDGVFFTYCDIFCRHSVDARSWSKKAIGTKEKENRTEKTTIQKTTRQRAFG